MNSSYAIHFKGAADFGEAQLELSQRCWHGALPSASFQLRARLALRSVLRAAAPRVGFSHRSPEGSLNEKTPDAKPRPPTRPTTRRSNHRLLQSCGPVSPTQG